MCATVLFSLFYVSFFNSHFFITSALFFIFIICAHYCLGLLLSFTIYSSIIFVILCHFSSVTTGTVDVFIVSYLFEFLRVEDLCIKIENISLANHFSETTVNFSDFFQSKFVKG
jgi:hypothetical protein